MKKRGVAGPWVCVDQPPPPTSLLAKARLELMRLVLNLTGRKLPTKNALSDSKNDDDQLERPGRDWLFA